MSTKYYRPLNRTIAGLVASWTDLVLPSAISHESLDASWECAVQADTTEVTDITTTYTHDAFAVGTLSSELDGWTYQACQDILQMLELTAPRDLELFSVPRSIEADGYKLDTNTILGVESKHRSTGLYIPAIKGHKKHKFQYTDTGSIYYATTASPVWWVDQGKVFIAPHVASTYDYYINTIDYPQHGVYWSNPLSETNIYDEDNYESNAAEATTIVRPITVIDHWITMQGPGVRTLVNDSSIETDVEVSRRSPEKYNIAIALYVGKELMAYRKRQLWKQLPPVLDYTADYAAAAEDSAGWEKVRWYVEQDEDQELTSMKIAELNGEQQKFILDYQWYDTTEKELERKYQQFFQNETQKKES